MSYPINTNAPSQLPKQGNIPNSNEGTLMGRNVEYGSVLGPVYADRFREVIGYNEINYPFEDSSEDDLDTVFRGVNSSTAAWLRTLIGKEHAENANSFVAESANGK